MLLFHLSTLFQFGLFVFVLLTGKREGRLWRTVWTGAVFSVGLEMAYYAPWVSVATYEWAVKLVDIAASILDLWLLAALIWDVDRCTFAGLFVIIATVWHELVKLEHVWAADSFRLPTGSESYLVPARAWSSWILLAAVAALAYCDSCATRAEEMSDVREG